MAKRKTQPACSLKGTCDWPACGCAPPATLKQLVSTLTEADGRAFLRAYECEGQKWENLLYALQLGAEKGNWIVHSYG